MKFSFLLNVVLIAFISQFSIATATITPVMLPADKNATAIVKIDDFGRYIIQAHSDQGVAFGLNDKKYGKGEVTGEANKLDGRFSGFLDIGEYQLFSQTSEKNSNQVTFDIKRSQAINQGDVVVLKKAKIETVQLKNAQHYDFVLEVLSEQIVNIEAAGRNLEDLQLFKNGQWIVETTNRKSKIYPVEGKPLVRIRLSTKLQPGIYRLSAFGGLPQKWANEESTNPLYIRQGLKTLDLDSRHKLIISPFGEDFYYMQKGNNYLNVQLPIKTKFSLGLSSFYEDSDIFSQSFKYRTINKKMDSPATSISLNTNYRKIVKLTGKKNQSLLLTSLLKSNEYSQFDNANYTVASLSLNDPYDYADVTWYTKEYDKSKKSYFVTDYKAINVSEKYYYQRRFNINREVTLLLNIEDEGQYNLFANNKLKVFMKIEPIFRSKYSKEQKYRSSNFKWYLNKGLYLLSIKPDNKGLLDLTIKHKSINILRTQFNSVFNNAPHQAILNHKRLNSKSTLVMLNNENILGFDIRKTKVNLSKSMSLYLLPSQSITLETLYVKDGKLEFDRNVNNKITVSINNSKHKLGNKIKANFKIQPTTFKNTSKNTINFVVKFVAIKTAAQNKTKTFTQKTLNKVPDYDELNVNNQPYFKLDGVKTFSMKVKQSGLYAVESTGLLSTVGVIRNKLNQQYKDNKQNGSGRNFYIQSYLLSGDYQLAINSAGKSKGNTALILSYSPIIDKGELKLGAKYFETIKNTEALKYKINIKEAARYNIKALTVDSDLQIRLDDIDGWPVIKPGSNGSRVQYLEKGEYYITVLPKPVSVASSLLVEKVTDKIKYPQNDEVKILNLDAINKNNQVKYTWLERTNKQGDRVKDRWVFELNTDANISIEFSDKMAITLINTQNNKQIGLFDIKETYRNNVWSSMLKKGRYELQFVAKGKNNKLAYTFNVSNTTLLFGQNKPLSLPQNVSFKLATSEQISVTTFGQSDVVAKLYDGDNQLINSFDDNGDNWNLMLNATLAKGEYRLELDTLTNSRSTILSFNKPNWDQYTELLLPVSKQITAENNLIIPLVIESKSTHSDILNLVVSSKQSINVTIEEFKFNAWQEISYQYGENVDILMPMKMDLNPLRVKIFSSLNQPLNVKFSVALQSIVVTNESELLQDGIKAHKVLDQSNWFVSKIDDMQLSKYAFERNVKTSQDISQAINRESNMLFSQKPTVWLASKYSLIKANIEYLNQVNQVALQQNEQAVINNNVTVKYSDEQVVVTRASVMQDHAAIYYQTKKQDKQNTMALDLNYSVTSTLFVALDDQSLIVKNAMQSNNSMLVKLEHTNFELPKIEKWQESFSGILNVGQAFVLKLPDDNRNTQMVIPQKTLVQFVLDEKIQASFYSEQSMQTILFEDQADTVFLFALDKKSQPFTVSKIERFNKSENNSDFEVMDIHKVLVSFKHLNNTQSKRQFIEVNQDSMLLDKNMNVQKGRSFKINNDAKLYISHDGTTTNLWRSDVLVNIETISDQAIDFKNNYELIENVIIDTQDIKQTLLKLSVDQLVNVHLIDRRGRVSHIVIQENDSYSMFVGDNLAFIEIQVVNSKISNIQAQTFKAQQLQEGVGELTIIASASSQLFKFNMQQDAIMGFANRSDSDQLNSTIFDKKGNVIQADNLLMQNLVKDEYWILVENTNIKKATQFQPVLLGTTENNAVDVNTINQYKQKAGWVK
ncbi:MAG: hypothetical protein HRU38_07255 [Saccharospirillaceae bacterium]|nr:hypothetical protein [Pseudomonadales bacterium]NRB78451.1 hypothetical protein [Saccharospirillaceae bacterium]